MHKQEIMPGTNLHLSTKETEVMLDSQWILTKHQIMRKIFDLFDGLNTEYKEEVKQKAYLFPENIKYQPGKISKGENYMLLPYLILDYPSFFWKGNFLAFRTMFWWGNFFSVTLHLSGENLRTFLKASLATFNFLKENEYYISVGEDEWQHHYESSNYKQIAEISFDEFKIITQKSFCKISKPLAAEHWKDANEFLLKTFKELLQLMELNYRDDKKDLLPAFPITGSGL